MKRVGFAIMDFIHYFFSSRLILFVLLMFVIINDWMDDLARFSRAVNYPVAIWAYALMFQKIYAQFMYGIAVVYFFSSVPFFQSRQLYVIMRQGRVRWLIDKCLRILFSSALLVLITVLICVIVLFPNIEIPSDWGKVLYTISMTDAASEYNINLPIYYEFIGVYTPQEAFFKALIILFSSTALIGFIMFALSVVFSRITAVICATVIPVLVIVAANISFRIYWFAALTPLSWLNLRMIDGSAYGLKIEFAHGIGTLTLICVICVCVLYVKIRTVDFEFVKEE